MNRVFVILMVLSYQLAQAQEAVTTPVQPQVPVEAKTKPESHSTVGMHYSLANEAKFSGQAAGYAYDETDTTTGALGIMLESVNPIDEKKRYTVGLSYDLQREFTYSRGSVAGLSFSGPYTKKPTLTILNTYVNYGFMSNPATEWYLGLGYSVPNLGNSTYSTSGALGYQFGVNLDTNEKFRIGAEYRVINCSLTGSVSGYSVTANNCSLNGLSIFWKTIMK